MSQEKNNIENVMCSKTDCKKIFLRGELIPFGNILVIPEHQNVNVDGLCSGSFEPPIEMVNTRDSNLFKKS